MIWIIDTHKKIFVASVIVKEIVLLKQSINILFKNSKQTLSSKYKSHFKFQSE